MAKFPVIQSPCPYKNNLADILQGDVCSMCKREVHDLTAMTDEGRVEFFAACNGADVCVKYEARLPRTLARAALGLAVAAMPLPLAAQEVPATTADAGAADYDEMQIIVGGIKDTRNVDYIDTQADLKTPELPVIVEDAPAKPVLGAGSPTG